MTIDLHETPLSPFCRSVKVLAKRIGVDLNLVYVDLPNKEQTSEAYLELNPFHTVPTLKDNGFVLFESRAIMTYLVSKYAPESALYPKDVQQRALVESMLNFDAGTLAVYPLIRVRSIFLTGKEAARPIVLEKNKENLKNLDTLLSKRKYAAGDNLTLADIAIIHTITLIEALEDDLSELKHLSEYVKTVRQDLGSDYDQVNAEATQQLKSIISSKRTP